MTAVDLKEIYQLSYLLNLIAAYAFYANRNDRIVAPVFHARIIVVEAIIHGGAKELLPVNVLPVDRYGIQGPDKGNDGLEK